MHRRRNSSGPRGFTLIELLVVIGILVLLMAILLPVVSHVKQQAYNTSTQSQMQRIMQACESYYHDFNAYPGPIANANLFGGTSPMTGMPGVNPSPGGSGQITSSENLVLGLIGFLSPPTGSAPITFVPAATNPPHDVVNLSALHPGVPSYHYIDYVPSELSAGLLTGTEGATMLPANDTSVPEFMDRFTDPMPILYMRANVGGNSVPPVGPSDTNGGVPFQYNYGELSAYGCNVQTTTGPVPLKLDAQYFPKLYGYSTGGTLSDSVTPPFADWDGTSTTPPNGYLINPNIAGSARGKDGFMLISAGVDRTYGTSDDTIITP